MGKMCDVRGQRFGRLVAIQPTDQRLCGQVVWECQCDCGKTAYISIRNLKSGNTTSCGCLHSEIVAEQSQQDLTGQRFGRLTAVRPTEKRVSGSVVWECLCDCGKTTYTSAANLKKGDSTSCGCLSRENLSKRKKIDITGEKFGYLTALRPTEKRSHGCVVWECKCDCGETTFVPTERLKSGLKSTCGCISQREYNLLHSY